MSVVNPENERLKRRYAEYLREGQGLAESTIDQALRSIRAYEAFGQFHDLARLSQKRRAIAFKTELLAKISGRSGVSTAETKLRHLRCFFEWLADQAGYRRKLSTLDWHFFQLSGRDRRVARERASQGCFTVEQWLQMIAASPCTTPAERRNQAMLSLLLLTGVRVGALITLKLKHVLPDQSGIHQDGYEVNTKLGRTFTTTFFPVGGRAKEVFGAYIAYLRSDLGFSDDDPLFPKSECEPVGGGFIWNALSRSHWETTDPVRSVLTQAAARASLPNFGPHNALPIPPTTTIVVYTQCFFGLTTPR